MSEEQQHTSRPVSDQGVANAGQEAIETRYRDLDPGPWQWKQSYELWDDESVGGVAYHWALESPKSAAQGRIVSHLLVLTHCESLTLGKPVEADPYLNFIAHSRDDIEWLCQRNRHLERQLAAMNNLTPALSERVIQALRTAMQLAEVASDWNLDEVEIDGEMVRTWDIRKQMHALLADLDRPQE